MALRLFTCKRCGHRLRFGSPQCGRCCEDTSMTNRGSFWQIVVGILFIGAMILVL